MYSTISLQTGNPYPMLSPMATKYNIYLTEARLIPPLSESEEELIFYRAAHHIATECVKCSALKGFDECGDCCALLKDAKRNKFGLGKASLGTPALD